LLWTSSEALPLSLGLESMGLALASSVVVVSLAVLGLDPVAVTARAIGCHELPANIHTAAELRRPTARLLMQSRTLRAQCARIAAPRATQVTVTMTTAPLDRQARARSRARRFDSGLLIVDIEIPAAAQNFLELLATNSNTRPKSSKSSRGSTSRRWPG
jgi:hypothetical protein